MDKVDNKSDKIYRGSNNPNNLDTSTIDADKVNISSTAYIVDANKADNLSILDIIDIADNKIDKMGRSFNNYDR